MEAHIRPSAYYFPRTSLVWVENTLNRAGGRVFPQEHAKAVADKARERGLASHLDGARLWNASVASGRSVEELAAPFDTVSVCFSKGLGAPVGSALVGSKSHIARAYRLRKMWGGGMRQAGIVAAGALYALQHHRERLKEDHANARILAESISSIAGVHVQRGNVETNMVIIDLDLNAEPVVAAARAEGLALSPWGVTQLRAVTHLDVSTQDMHDASDVLARVLKELRKGHVL